MNISMNPSYVEEFNGSDYVCMTGSASSASIKAAVAAHKATISAVAVPVTTGIATSSPTSIGTSKHISSMAPVAAEPLIASSAHHHHDDPNHEAPVSPTPSQLSSESGSGKRMCDCEVFYCVNVVAT